MFLYSLKHTFVIITFYSTDYVLYGDNTDIAFSSLKNEKIPNQKFQQIYYYSELLFNIHFVSGNFKRYVRYQIFLSVSFPNLHLNFLS